MLAWGGCLVFFLCYQQWFAWLCLVAVTFLPLVSLVLSLPALLTARLRVDMPAVVTLGTPVSANFRLISPVPLPQWQGKLVVGRELTKEGWALKCGESLPTDHCGCLECSLVGLQVRDYLGLFGRKLQSPPPFTLLVRPVPVESDTQSPLHPSRVVRWRPKPGGGYSENYDLRLYRPGDSLQRIHWKLSGKTGKLLLREALEPAQAPRFYLQLTGTPAQIDDKLGKLLYLGHSLTEQGVGFVVRARTGEGLLEWKISTADQLWQAMDQILTCRPAEKEEGGADLG